MNSKSASILVVDNDDSLTQAVSTRLMSAGYNCLIAYSGAQALSLFRENDIQLIITDLNMPAGDGVALATQVRKSSSVPIIFVTGFRNAYRRVMRSVPDVTILEKPFRTEELMSLVEISLAASTH